MAVATGDRRLRYRLWAAYCRTPAHRVQLWGRPPKGLALGLDERWPGDPRRGQAIVEGSYRFAGETVAGAEPPWDTGLAGAGFQAELHGFAWLADLAAVASEAATEKARALLRTWLERHDRWHPLVWRADVMGERLYAWIAYAELVAPEAGDGALRRTFLRSLGRQVRHLRRSAGWEAIGLGRLAALKGLLSFFLESETLNYVNAPYLARERGIAVIETRTRETTDYVNTITIAVRAASSAHEVAGAVVGNRGIRLIRIDNYHVEAVPDGYFLMLHNRDVPGVVGAVGTLLGQEKINIAGLELGRDRVGGMALSLVQIDGAVPPAVLEKIKTLPSVTSASLLKL